MKKTIEYLLVAMIVAITYYLIYYQLDILVCLFETNQWMLMIINSGVWILLYQFMVRWRNGKRLILLLVLVVSLSIISLSSAGVIISPTILLVIGCLIATLLALSKKKSTTYLGGK
jgi:hypothetical protein